MSGAENQYGKQFAAVRDVIKNIHDVPVDVFMPKSLNQIMRQFHSFYPQDIEKILRQLGSDKYFITVPFVQYYDKMQWTCVLPQTGERVYPYSFGVVQIPSFDDYLSYLHQRLQITMNENLECLGNAGIAMPQPGSMVARASAWRRN